MSVPVRKAVIPAAGLGTRFLPATKAQPKEMLPVVDKPAIQYVVEEAVAAGLTDILVVTGRNKQAIEDHFDRSPELEWELTESGKDAALAAVRRVSELATLHFVRQQEPKGLGHAVAMARDHVGDEPFAVLLPDELMVDGATVLRSMIEAHRRHARSVIALREVPWEEVSAYGCVGSEPEDGSLVRVVDIVEKPAREDAPSNLVASGRYVFTPAMFDALGRVGPGRGGEIQLTDAIALLLEDEVVHGWIFEEGRFDMGKPSHFLRATVELAADHDDLGEDFRAFLVDFVRRRKLA